MSAEYLLSPSEPLWTQKFNWFIFHSAPVSNEYLQWAPVALVLVSAVVLLCHCLFFLWSEHWLTLFSEQKAFVSPKKFMRFIFALKQKVSLTIFSEPRSSLWVSVSPNKFLVAVSTMFVWAPRWAPMCPCEPTNFTELIFALKNVEPQTPVSNEYFQWPLWGLVSAVVPLYGPKDFISFIFESKSEPRWSL